MGVPDRYAGWNVLPLTSVGQINTATRKSVRWIDGT
jgi:hypothetical protein